MNTERLVASVPWIAIASLVLAAAPGAAVPAPVADGSASADVELDGLGSSASIGYVAGEEWMGQNATHVGQARLDQNGLSCGGGGTSNGQRAYAYVCH